MELWLPYIVAVLCAIVSGIASYLAAKKQCDTTIESLKESNQHDIEMLMKQHEVDIENLKNAHELEMERLELEHRHQLESDATKMQNQVVAGFADGLFNAVLSNPAVGDALGSKIKEELQG